MIRREGIVDEPFKQPMVLPLSVLNKISGRRRRLGELVSSPFSALDLPIGVAPNKWKNSGIRGDSGHIRADLLADTSPTGALSEP